MLLPVTLTQVSELEALQPQLAPLETVAVMVPPSADIVVDTGVVGGAGGRGAEVVRVLAEAGLYPSEVRRAPTLEIAYTDLIGGFRGRG